MAKLSITDAARAGPRRDTPPPGDGRDAAPQRQVGAPRSVARCRGAAYPLAEIAFTARAAPRSGGRRPLAHDGEGSTHGLAAARGQALSLPQRETPGPRHPGVPRHRPGRRSPVPRRGAGATPAARRTGGLASDPGRPDGPRRPGPALVGAASAPASSPGGRPPCAPGLEDAHGRPPGVLGAAGEPEPGNP